MDFVTILLIVKAIIVLFFLLMFLRRTNWVWGIGLLTITTAVLLDTFLSTFDRAQTIADLGFFASAIDGMLVGGMAVWAWGLLRPLTATTVTVAAAAQPHSLDPSTPIPNAPLAIPDSEIPDYELLKKTYNNLDWQDMRDLLFDAQINENDVMPATGQTTSQLIINSINYAEQHGEIAQYEVALDRIINPIPPENLPRLDKINADSPPTVLRHYLLAHYTLAELEQMATTLNLDWEQLEMGSKKTKVRSLLVELGKNGRLAELISLLQA